MKSFSPGFIEKQPLTQNLLQVIRLLGEYKGKQELYTKQSPQILENLKQVALIQSTESSSRLEGITAPLNRIKQILADKTNLRNRSEQEIAGYRNVLSTIHSNYPHIPLTTNIALQFHRDLYQFTNENGGRWKPSDNTISEKHPDGTLVTRFKPVAAFLTPQYMKDFHNIFQELWEEKSIEPLLLIPTYILDFLCIHPFRDGNGRMSRLLSNLLLYQAGYEVGRYISLEKIVEKTKESYYDALYKSSQKWHKGKHTLLPWWEYFLGVVLLSAYKEFETRIDKITTTRGAKSEMILEVIQSIQGVFSVQDVYKRCPNVSLDMVRKIFQQEKKAGRMKCITKGRYSRWKYVPENKKRK